MRRPIWFLILFFLSVIAFSAFVLSKPETVDPADLPISAQSLEQPLATGAQARRPALEVRPPATIEQPKDENLSSAMPEATATYTDDRFASPNVAGAISQTFSSTLGWGNAQAEDLRPLIGDTFTVTLPDGRVVDLLLAEVIPGPVDPARPAILQRRRSVSGVLTARPEVLATLNTYGAENVTIFHPDIGRSEVMFGVYPTETGGKILEFMLN